MRNNGQDDAAACRRMVKEATLPKVVFLGESSLEKLETELATMRELDSVYRRGVIAWAQTGDRLPLRRARLAIARAG